jgi:Ca2+-dependent lipid-binding protein
MNTLLEVCWGIVNPDMFQAVADTLEDVMRVGQSQERIPLINCRQASLPGIVEHIRVAEINQGSNPVRVLSLRSLPDSHVQEMKNFIHEENEKSKDPQEAAAGQ